MAIRSIENKPLPVSDRVILGDSLPGPSPLPSQHHFPGERWEYWRSQFVDRNWDEEWNRERFGNLDRYPITFRDGSEGEMWGVPALDYDNPHSRPQLGYRHIKYVVRQGSKDSDPTGTLAYAYLMERFIEGKTGWHLFILSDRVVLTDDPSWMG